jgi:hypothetical protein
MAPTHKIFLENKFRRMKSHVRSQCSWEHKLQKGGLVTGRFCTKIFSRHKTALLIVYEKSVSNSRKNGLDGLNSYLTMADHFPLKNQFLLTFWRRNFCLILAHPVYKMWILQEPNKLELWNKLHFEVRKKNGEYTPCLKY